MATLPFMFVCLLWFSVNCEVQIENGSNTVRTYDSEISAVLNHLNSSSFKVYKYKEATLLHAQIKADIIELALEIKVDCINNYPDVPCSAKVLTCHAFVRKTPDGDSQVLNDVNCKPKPEIIVMEPSYESPTYPTNANINEAKSIALSNEAVSSEVNEPFMAVRRDSVPCLGCPFDLNTNAEGVDDLIDLALEHVGTERSNKQALVKVLRVQQEVVSGVKYILIAEIGATVCTKDDAQNSCPLDSSLDTTICKITYLQKPWISKAKHIINNNCTVSQEYVKSDGKKPDISNEIDAHDQPTKPSVNFDRIAESGIFEMSPSRLGDLESQIVLDLDDSDQEQKNVKPLPKVETPAPSTTTPQLSDLESQIIVYSNSKRQNMTIVQASSSTAQALPSTAQDLPSTAQALPSTAQDLPSTAQALPSTAQALPSTAQALPSTGQDLPSTAQALLSTAQALPSTAQTQVGPRIEDNGKSGVVTREGVTLSPEAREVKEPTPKPECEEARPKVNKRSEEVLRSDLETTTWTGETSTSTKKEVKINSSEEKSDSSEEVPKRTTSSADLKTEDKSSQEASSEEKYRGKRAIPQLEKISPEEKGLVKNLADFAAAALDNIDDDNHRRVILQILGAKKMVGDDGVYYHLIMRMGISRCLEDRAPNPYENCRDKLFENYTKICKVQVYVNDDLGSPRVVKSQCQNIKKDKNDSNRTNYSRFRRETLVGGQQEIDKNSDKVKELLNQGLTQLNARWDNENKHKLVDVNSATSQVVAGVLYRFGVKLVETQCPKDEDKELADCEVRQGAKPTLCTVKVWEKSWENFRQYTISCDGDSNKYKFQTTISDKTKRSIPGEPFDIKRSIPGDPFDISSNDKYFFKYLEAALNELDAESSHKNKLKVYEMVTLVINQHIKGEDYYYRFRAKVIQSDCPKQSPMERSECGTLEGAEPQTCGFYFHERYAKPKNFTLQVDCDNGLHLFRTTRDLKYSMDGDPTPRGEKSHFALFDDFRKKYKKRYTKKEYKYRFQTFRENLNRIKVLNQYEQGTAKYGITRFADMTQQEFSKSLGFRPDLRKENELPFAHARIPDIELPKEFDWRTKGAVTEVKNQEQCGSCWAFSVTGNVEGQYAIKHGKLLEFSEQELVDCDKEDQGCNGGLMDNAYREIEKLGGLETEQDYPYEAEDEKCHLNKSLTRVQLSGALNISHNETDMAKWLVANGPISIAINANAMQFYFGGVSHPFSFLCNPNNLDHGVLIVGYGVHTYPLFNKVMPYWIVKNSWGTSWGEQGYYRVYRGGGTCGLNQTPSSAIVV